MTFLFDYKNKKKFVKSVFNIKFLYLQASTLIATGLGLAVVGFTGRYIIKKMPHLSQKMAEVYKNVPKLNPKVNLNIILYLYKYMYIYNELMKTS